MVGPREADTIGPSEYQRLSNEVEAVRSLAKANRWLLGVLVGIGVAGVGLTLVHAAAPYHPGMLSHVSVEVQRIEDKIEKRDAQVNGIFSQLSALSAEVRGMTRSLDRINDKIDEYDQNIRRFYRENPAIKDPNLGQ